MPYRCQDCGDPLAASEVAAEYTKRVMSPRNANKAVGPTRRYCRECHAQNEWKREQAVRAYQQSLLDQLTPEERAGYEARAAARSNKS